MSRLHDVLTSSCKRENGNVVGAVVELSFPAKQKEG